MMNGGMMGPQWQIQEVLDSNGKVTGRTLVPATPGMGGQGQSNPIVEIVLKNALERETMLMQQSMNNNKPITDLFMSMIGNFKSNSDPVAQLANLRQGFPELFEKKTDTGPQNLEVYKLKFDTDLAMMAQRIELKKMDHQWKMEQIDRESQNSNAKQWMEMIETFGEKLGVPLATAVMGGMAGGQGPQPGPGGMPIAGRPPPMMPGEHTSVVPGGPAMGQAPIPQPKPETNPGINLGTPNPGPDPAVLAVAVQQEQQTRQLQSIMLAMEQEIGRLRSDNQKMNNKLNQGIAGPRKAVNINTIKKLPSSTLKEALVEFNHEQSRNEEIGRLLQTELADRELTGSDEEGPEEGEEDLGRKHKDEGDDEGGDEDDVSATQAQGALDEDEQADFEEPDILEEQGVSTKPMHTGDQNNALSADDASVPSEISSNFEAYEKTAKELDDVDKDID
jgi:hypothetical protein